MHNALKFHAGFPGHPTGQPPPMTSHEKHLRIALWTSTSPFVGGRPLCQFHQHIKLTKQFSHHQGHNKIHEFAQLIIFVPSLCTNRQKWRPKAFAQLIITVTHLQIKNIVPVGTANLHRAIALIQHKMSLFSPITRTLASWCWQTSQRQTIKADASIQLANPTILRHPIHTRNCRTDLNCFALPLLTRRQLRPGKAFVEIFSSRFESGSKTRPWDYIRWPKISTVT